MHSPSIKSGLALCAALAANTFATVDGSTLYGLVSLPLGSFAGVPGGQGKAKIGGGAGFDYTYPLPWSNLGVMASVSFSLNPMDDAEVSAARPGESVELGSWFNAPVLAGLKYQISGDPLDFYAFGQAGGDAAWQSFSKVGGDRLETDLVFSFAAGVGLGIIINERVDLGLKYLFLGQPSYDGVWVNNDTSVSGKQKFSLIAFVLGIHIK
jgi:opacity protein-like surface antigen